MHTGGLSNTDYPKDVAALANAGGGVLVYGVKESDKAAVRRKDTGNLTEPHAAALTAAAVSAISPPGDDRRCHVPNVTKLTPLQR